MHARYASYGGGGVGVRDCVSSHWGSYHASMVDRMMLKFRPIAPKPVASESASSDSTGDNVCKSGRNKMRYVRVKRNASNKKRKSPTSPPSDKVSGGGDAVVTLPLMPETPTGKDYLPIKNISSPVWLLYYKNIYSNSTASSSCSSSSSNNNNNYNQTSCDGHVALPQSERPRTVSFVTAERVEEVRMDGGVIEWTKMDGDTCPRFISDGGDRVVWKNKAYKEMVAGGDEVAVVVVRKEGGWPAAFTCNVRVTCRTGVGSLTVPCDAWRMEGGGYAWRLDVKAALCLGR